MIKISERSEEKEERRDKRVEAKKDQSKEHRRRPFASSSAAPAVCRQTKHCVNCNLFTETNFKAIISVSVTPACVDDEKNIRYIIKVQNHEYISICSNQLCTN